MEKELRKLKFIKIADYSFDKEKKNVVCKNVSVKKTERIKLVYIFIVNKNIMYVGKTSQGYIRPLGYHKNNVMLRVKEGIEKECKQGNLVSVYIRKDDFDISFETMNINMYESIETALIQKFKPLWNSF